MESQTPPTPGSQPPSQTDMILGRPADQAPKDVVAAVAPDQIDPVLRPRYQQLLQIRDYLIDMENTLESQGKQIKPTDRQEADAESATSVNLRDMAFSRATTYAEFIEEVNAALSRIEQGTYGRCELTGEPIPSDRLDAVPWTRFTAEAEARLEEEGKQPTQFHLPEAGRLKGKSGVATLDEYTGNVVDEGPTSPS